MSRSAQWALLAGLLSLAGCQTHPAHDAPETSAAERAVPSATEPSATAPGPPANPPPTAPVAAVSQSKPASHVPKVPPKTPTATAAAPQPKPAAAAPAAASLDLNSLEQRLKDTRAIGVFTKLSLKNQVDDLLDDLREFHKGSSKLPQPMLRQNYDLLIMKVLSLLQDGDPPLASAIASSREAIWQILMDPGKFAKI